MEIECLTPEFPQGARVYSSDGIAPTLLNSASAMRSQSILIRGGGSMKVHSEKSMCLAGNFVDRNTNQKRERRKRRYVFYAEYSRPPRSRL